MPKFDMEAARARVEEIDVEMRAIDTEAGSESLTEEQQTRWDALDSEQSGLNRDIKVAEDRQAVEDRRAAHRARWGSVQVAPTKTSAPFDLNDAMRMRGDELIDRAKSALDGAYGNKSPDAVKEVVRKLDEHGDELARYMLVHGSPDYRSGFAAVMQAAAGNRAPILTQGEADAMRASMSLTSANGGYALPTLLDPTLIKTGTMTKNPIRSISRVEQGTQDKWNGVTVGNVTTYWKAEGSAFTDGSPTTGGVTIDAAMLTAYVTGSFEIFADSNLMGQLPGLIGEAIDMAEGVAFISGSGSDAPYGIVTAVSGTAGSLVTVTTRGTFNSTSGVDTLALFNALPSRYEDSATFVSNKVTLVSIEQQTFGTAGGRIVDLMKDDMILKTPYVKASSLPSATTSGNIMAVLGDFSQYIIYDRLGVNVEIIQNVVDGSGLPTGQRGLIAYKRVGAKPSDLDAFRLLKA